MRALSCIAVLAVTAAACAPSLSARSPAPPGRSARLDEVSGFWGVKSYRLEVSAGVAIAIQCYRMGAPCEKLEIRSDEARIADVRLASLGTLEPSGFTNRAPAAAFVIVGRTPGTTKVRVQTKGKGREITVTVVAPPAPPPPPATVAAPD
jgi:hypothetical protein